MEVKNIFCHRPFYGKEHLVKPPRVQNLLFKRQKLPKTTPLDPSTTKSREDLFKAQTSSLDVHQDNPTVTCKINASQL